MKELKGKVAAITGAASGIGRSTAVLLAREGCRCAIADKDEEGLRRTERSIEELGVAVHATVLDVADREAVYAWAGEVAREFGGVNIVINNAGVSLTTRIEEMNYQDLDWLLGINLFGMIYGTKAFLPYLKEADEGHVVNISSVFGLVTAPNQSAYSTAKFGIRGFTECLRMELALSGCNITVTAVYPGGVKTNLSRNARICDSLVEEAGVTREEMDERFERIVRVSPEEAAAKIVEGVRKNRSRVLIGADAHLFDMIQRLAPSGYTRLMAWGFRVINRPCSKRMT